MSKYTEILEKVQSYLQDNNKEVKEGEITLYELYDIVDKTINELYREDQCKELLKKVNEEIPITNIIGKIFKKKEICSRYESISLFYDEKDVGIWFYAGFRNESNLEIYKDSESNELYIEYGELTDYKKEILEKHYDEILDILTSLQEYKEVTGGYEKYSRLKHKEQIIDDGFMKATISLSNYGRVDIKLEVNRTVDPDNVANREYYRQEKIQNVIDDNKKTIAKNIIFNENDLNDDYKRILNRSKKNKKER